MRAETNRGSGQRLREVKRELQRWRRGAADPFDSLTLLQRHEQEGGGASARWLPWNYREQLDQQ